MTRISFQVTVGFAVLFASAFSAHYILAACDDMGASASVGACYTPMMGQLTCGGQTTDAACTAASNNGAIVVNQDFPTSCISSPGNNCNQPLANCWTNCECQWANGMCQTMNQGTSWNQVAERTTQACPGG